MNVRFLKPMECLPVQKLPTGGDWTYEVKLDGFRVEAVRSDRLILYSKQGKLLTSQFMPVAAELERLPAETVIDGEVVALDENGLPRFNLLQNHRSGSHLMYFVFDVMVHKGKDVTMVPLSERRALLKSIVRRGAYVQLAEWTDNLESLEHFVREQRLEGIIAKRSDSRYQLGTRSGSWAKMRFDCRQEFVIGGYTPSHLGVDALLVGFYRGSTLRFAGSVRAGFNPPMRREVHNRIKAILPISCGFLGYRQNHRSIRLTFSTGGRKVALTESPSAIESSQDAPHGRPRWIPSSQHAAFQRAMRGRHPVQPHPTLGTQGTQGRDDPVSLGSRGTSAVEPFGNSQIVYRDKKPREMILRTIKIFKIGRRSLQNHRRPKSTR